MISGEGTYACLGGWSGSTTTVGLFTLIELIDKLISDAFGFPSHRLVPMRTWHGLPLAGLSP